MLKRFWKLIATSFRIFRTVNASRMSAALTYYTMLSLAPLLMIAVAIAGYVFESELAITEIVEQVRLISTPEIAETVEGLIQNAVRPRTGLIAGTISVCIFVFAASGVFAQLYDTFNDIWRVPKKTRRHVLFSVQKRALGILMVLIAGLFLIGAVAVNSALVYMNQLVEGIYPNATSWLNVADRSLTYLLMPVMFSVMFWFLPATKIQWRDVWPAGIVTTVLFAGSRYLVGLYLKFSTTSEVYGAAGSLVVLLIWVYMTGLVVFYGASFSHAWATVYGSRSGPLLVTEKESVEPTP